MDHRRFRALVLTLTLLAAGPALGAAPPDATHANDNAAMLYWQAFAHMPALDEQQEKVVADAQTAPLSADAVKVIDSAATSLKYLHYGAKLRRCDWGYPLEEGMELLLPHLKRSRDLARLACLRARHRVQQGDAAGAVEDLGDAMTLARHAGNDAILISLLVRYNIENMVIEAAAANMAGLDAAALKRLRERLDALPEGVPLRESIRFERDSGLRWIAQRVKAVAGKEDWVTQAFAPLAAVDDDLRAAVKASGDTPEGVLEQLDRLGAFYEEIPQALSQPPGQAHAALAALGEKTKANPFAKLLLPQYAKVYDAHTRAAARLAMLKAATAVATGGQGQLKDHPDPYGQGTFEYRANPQGFELQSKLTFEGKPVTLTVRTAK